jgi:cytochrome P450 family 33
LGNLIELSKSPPGDKTFEKWRKEYGPIFTYWIGEQPWVAFADYETINKTFIEDSDSFDGRAYFTEFYLLCRCEFFIGTFSYTSRF